MSLSRVCFFNGSQNVLYIYYFQRGKVLKLLPYVQFLSHSDKVTLNIILLGFIKKQRENAVTSNSYYYRYITECFAPKVKTAKKKKKKIVKDKF